MVLVDLFCSFTCRACLPQTIALAGKDYCPYLPTLYHSSLTLGAYPERILTSIDNFQRYWRLHMLVVTCCRHGSGRRVRPDHLRRAKLCGLLYSVFTNDEEPPQAIIITITISLCHYTQT